MRLISFPPFPSLRADVLRFVGLHGIYFDKALARAKELDEQLEKTGKTAGPLRAFFPSSAAASPN